MNTINTMELILLIEMIFFTQMYEITILLTELCFVHQNILSRLNKSWNGAIDREILLMTITWIDIITAKGTGATRNIS